MVHRQQLVSQEESGVRGASCCARCALGGAGTRMSGPRRPPAAALLLQLIPEISHQASPEVEGQPRGILGAAQVGGVKKGAWPISSASLPAG